ncbi:hypothetical protein D9M73_157100 [compost metagenome]
MIDAAEQLPILVDHVETFQLVPVELVFVEIRQFADGNADFKTCVGAGDISIDQPLQLHHQDLAMQASAGDFNLLYLVVTPERPTAVIEHVIQRVGEGVDLHLTTYAVHRENLAENDEFVGGGRRRAHKRCLGSSLGSFLQQLSNALRRLGALAQPVVGAFLVNGQLDFRTGGDRVEETDALYEATVARIAAVGHGQVVEGALLGAATGKTDGYH